MAHPCFECGSECYCHGDIDDVIVSKTPRNCEGCGCDDLFEDDSLDDDDYIFYECLCCGNEQDESGPCDRCTAYALEPIYL